PLSPAALARLLTVLLSVTIFAVVWRRRAQPGAAPFALMLMAAGWWSAGALLEHAATAPATKLVYAALEYPGIMAVAPLWLLFALGYAGHGGALGRSGAAARARPLSRPGRGPPGGTGAAVDRQRGLPPRRRPRAGRRRSHAAGLRADRARLRGRALQAQRPLRPGPRRPPRPHRGHGRRRARPRRPGPRDRRQSERAGDAGPDARAHRRGGRPRAGPVAEAGRHHR